MKARFAGVVFLLLSGAWLLVAEPVWEDKSYTEWTLEEARQILRDSPWAQLLGEPVESVTGAPTNESEAAGSDAGASNRPQPFLLNVPKHGEVSQAGAGGGRNGVVQWVSAFTMRQAMVRSGQLQGTMNPNDASQLLMMTPEQYVIAVRGPIVTLVMAGIPEPNQEALQQSAFLQPVGSEPIRPLGIEVNLDGMPSAFFYFPRGEAAAPLLSLEQGTVEFQWSSGLDTVSASFDLSKMTRSGRPDL